MAVPKKKVSRSRRNMRRFSAAYQLDPVSWTASSVNQELVRPHTVTLDTVDAYVKARSEKKAARNTKSA
jgi:ribosomal protein L32